MTELSKIRVPILERLALSELAFRRAKSDEETLAELIREAARRELADAPDALQAPLACQGVPHD